MCFPDSGTKARDICSLSCIFNEASAKRLHPFQIVDRFSKSCDLVVEEID
jgi:hypothetical protein